MRTYKHCDKPFSKSVIKSYQLRNLAIANACNRNNIQRDLMSLPRHANYFRTRHFDQSNYRRSTIAVRSADWHPAIADWSLDLQVTQGFLKTYQKNIFSSSIVTIILQKCLHHCNPRVFHCQHVLQCINHDFSPHIASSWLYTNGIKAHLHNFPHQHGSSCSISLQTSLTMLRVPNVRVCKPFGKLLRDHECNGVE